MLISLNQIKKFIKEPPKGILQCGAYNGQGQDEWNQWGCANVLYVEPNPVLFEQLEKRVGSENCRKFAVCDKDGLDLDFHLCYSRDLTNLGASSLFEPTEILKKHSALRKTGVITVRTTTIDKLLESRPEIDTLVLDIEGAELLALQGAEKVLPQIKNILLEFTTETRFDGDCTLAQLDHFLLPKGFKRVITEFATEVWGDALFIRV